MMRIVEDGLLEKETPPTSFGAPAMGAPSGLGMMGGPMGIFGGMPGEESGIGMTGPMAGAPGAPTMPGITGFVAGPYRLRLRPIDSQKVALFTLLPNGNLSTSEEIPNIVKLASGSIDVVFPEEILKVGKRWIGFITLPRNLENLTIIGATMGGMPGAP